MKIKYRCTHEAGTGWQCKCNATDNVNGRWLCDAHTDTNTPLILKTSDPRPYLGSGKNAAPEERKAYNRRYRKEYRLTHERKKVYVWPEVLTQWDSKHKLWLIAKPMRSDTALYHCDRCGTQVSVKRIKCDRHYTDKTRLTTTHFWVAGTHYRAFYNHICVSLPQVKLRRCDRCGTFGSKYRINDNRSPASWYGDKLCLKCWRKLRPFFKLQDENSDLYRAMKDLRKAMRQHGMTPHKWMIKFEYPTLDYREGWFKYRSK